MSQQAHPETFNARTATHEQGGELRAHVRRQISKHRESAQQAGVGLAALSLAFHTATLCDSLAVHVGECVAIRQRADELDDEALGSMAIDAADISLEQLRRCLRTLRRSTRHREP